MVTDSNGYINQLLSYYPFGAPRIETQYGSAIDQTKRFTGHDYDQETRLNYMGARYQNPEVGQFISQDPANLESPEQFLKDPQQLNTYSYARNNPLRHFDPDGRASVDSQIQAAQNKAISEQLQKIYTSLQQLSLFISSIGHGAVDPVAGVRTTANSKNFLSQRTGSAIGTVIGVVSSTFAPEERTGQLLLNPAIKITDGALNHIVERHTINGASNIGTSLFNEGENVHSLIQQGTQQVINSQSKGNNFQRIFNVGRNIGIDRMTGQQTSIMTVITNAAHELVTAFPGLPFF